MLGRSVFRYSDSFSTANSLGGNEEIKDPLLDDYIANHLTFKDRKKLHYVSKVILEKARGDIRVAIFTWNLEDVKLCAYGKEKSFFKKCVKADFAEKLFNQMTDKGVDIFAVSLQGKGNSEEFIDSLLRENVLNGYKAKSAKDKKGPADLVLFYKSELEINVKGRKGPLECRGDGKDPLFFSTSSAANIIEIGYADKNLFLFFVSAVLPSSKEGRNSCLQRIISEIEAKKTGVWSAVYFVSGDLKYQINTPEPSPRLEDVGNYYKKDELASFSKEKGYSEAPIGFLPTCRVEKTKTESKDGGGKRYREYVDVEKEPPAWCDRIIYKSKGEIKLTPLRYDDMDYGDAVTFSSHKPVVGIYDIKNIK